MKLRSSIFSSESLDVKWRLPGGAVLAMVIVAMANFWAFKAREAGIIYTSVPRQMVQESIEKLTSTSGTWWLGNSTMAAGVDKTVIDRELGGTNAFVELGSATLDVQVRLAATALSRMQSGPERIVLFVTKDDLNANGSRATASSSYMQAFESPGLYEIFASYFPLYSCRYAIVDRLRDSLAGMLAGNRPRHLAVHKKVTAPAQYNDLGNETNTTYLHNLGRDFREINVNFDDLSKQAQRAGSRVLLVAPPVTRSIQAWQERYAPEYPWQRLLGNLASQAASSGIGLYDYSGHLESTTEYFKDVYHLNSRGASRFTRYLLEDLGKKPGIPKAPVQGVSLTVKGL